MSLRNVKIVSTSMPKMIKENLDIKTFGELTSALDANFENMTVVLRYQGGVKQENPTSNTVLLDGDIVVYASPKQNKGAANTPDLTSLSFTELRKLAANEKINLGSNPSKVALIEALEKHFKSAKVKAKAKTVVKEKIAVAKKKPVEQVKAVPVAAVQEETFNYKRSSIIRAIADLKRTVDEKIDALLAEIPRVFPNENLVFIEEPKVLGLSDEELEAELKEIKKEDNN